MNCSPHVLLIFLVWMGALLLLVTGGFWLSNWSARCSARRFADRMRGFGGTDGDWIDLRNRNYGDGSGGGGDGGGGGGGGGACG